MAALAAIYAAVMDEVDATAARVVSGNPIRHLGAEWLGAQEAPPRFVWVPIDDAPRGEEMHYPDAVTATVTARALAELDETVEVHVWGADWDQAEDLRDLLINALRHTAGAAFRVLRGGWKVQDAGAITHLGRAYVLTISFPVPVLEIPGGIATITSVQQDTATEGTP